MAAAATSISLDTPKRDADVSTLESPPLLTLPFVLVQVLPFLAQSDRVSLLSLKVVQELFVTGELRPLAVDLRDSRADLSSLAFTGIPVVSLGLSDLSPDAAPVLLHDRRADEKASQGATWKAASGLSDVLLRGLPALSRTLKELIIPSAFLQPFQCRAISQLERLEVLDVSGCSFESSPGALRTHKPKFCSTLRSLACGPSGSIIKAWLREGVIFDRVEHLTCGVASPDEGDLFIDKILEPSVRSGTLKRLSLVSSRVPSFFRFVGERPESARAVCQALQSLELVECELARRQTPDLRGRGGGSEHFGASLSEVLAHCGSLEELRIIDPTWPRQTFKLFVQECFSSLVSTSGHLRTLDLHWGSSFVKRRSWMYSHWDDEGANVAGAGTSSSRNRGDLTLDAMLRGFTGLFSLPSPPTLSPRSLFSSIEHFSLFDSAMTNSTGLRILCSSFTKLRSLDLSFCAGVDDGSIEMLCEAPFASSLQTFKLNGCKEVVTCASLERVACSCPALRELHIKGLHLAVDACLKKSKATDVVQLQACLFLPPRMARVFYIPKPLGSDQLDAGKKAEGELCLTLTSAGCCSGCGVRLRDPRDFTDHLIVCPSALTPCPLAPEGCTFRGTRLAIGSHLSSCGHNVVKCGYHRSGCSETLTRGEYHRHCETQHGSALETDLLSLDCEMCPNRASGCRFREYKGPAPRTVVPTVLEHLAIGHCQAAEHVCAGCGRGSNHKRGWMCGGSSCAALAAVRAGFPAAVLCQLLAAKKPARRGAAADSAPSSEPIDLMSVSGDGAKAEDWNYRVPLRLFDPSGGIETQLMAAVSARQLRPEHAMKKIPTRPRWG